MDSKLWQKEKESFIIRMMQDSLRSGESETRPVAVIAVMLTELPRSQVQIDQAHLDRGNGFLSRLYGRQIHTDFKNRFGSHLQDIRWQQERVVYGIFLSDHTVLTDVETEMVILAAFMCGMYHEEKEWHLRGFRRLGPTLEETHKIQQAMKIVANWCGKDVDGWPKPEDVESEV